MAPCCDNIIILCILESVIRHGPSCSMQFSSIFMSLLTSQTCLVVLSLPALTPSHLLSPQMAPPSTTLPECPSILGALPPRMPASLSKHLIEVQPSSTLVTPSTTPSCSFEKAALLLGDLLSGLPEGTTPQELTLSLASNTPAPVHTLSTDLSFPPSSYPLSSSVSPPLVPLLPPLLPFSILHLLLPPPSWSLSSKPSPVTPLLSPPLLRSQFLPSLQSTSIVQTSVPTMTETTAPALLKLSFYALSPLAPSPPSACLQTSQQLITINLPVHRQLHQLSPSTSPIKTALPPHPQRNEWPINLQKILPQRKMPPKMLT